MAYGIKVTQEVFNKANMDKVSINKAMKDIYKEQIDKAVSENKALSELSPVEMALVDTGLDLNSKVSNFYSHNGNEYLFPAILETKIINAVDSNPFLNMLINSTKIVDSKDVRTLKLDYSTSDAKSKLSKRDVAEGTELPEVKITESSSVIKIHKRGIKVTSTYEAIQDATVNQFLQTLQQAERNSAYQQIGDVADVLVNGDGNSNAAGVLGSFATASTITTTELLNYLIDYYDATNGLACDTILCGKAEAKLIANLLVDLDKINGYRADKSFKFPQFNFSDINVLYDTRVPQVGSKNSVVLLNKAESIDKFTIANSIINEFDKNIGNQTEIGTLSERCGFGKINDNATKVIKMA